MIFVIMWCLHESFTSWYSTRVITDTREWRHFKQVHQVNTPVEEGMFSKSAETNQLPEIFLRPKETVNIPFKFVMFSADQSVQPQVRLYFSGSIAKQRLAK